MKVLSLVFRALNCDEAPAYLRDLLSIKTCGRSSLALRLRLQQTGDSPLQ